jgi:hypothetical protein
MGISGLAAMLACHREWMETSAIGADCSITAAIDSRSGAFTLLLLCFILWSGFNLFGGRKIVLSLESWTWAANTYAAPFVYVAATSMTTVLAN